LKNGSDVCLALPTAALLPAGAATNPQRIGRTRSPIRLKEAQLTIVEHAGKFAEGVLLLCPAP
jgi:hypothetical protein